MSIASVENLSSETLALLRRNNLLHALIKAELVRESVKDIELSGGQREKAWNQYKTKKNLDNPDLVDTHLRKNGLREEELRWQLELPIRVQLHSQANFGHKAEARFLARKEQLDLVVYSLLRLRDGYLAREFYLRISGGEANFADLAATYSEGPEAKTKGIVGPVPMTNAHPALSERLRTSRAGQLLQPFQVEQWWLVARLERYEPAKFDDSTRQRMAEELFQEWLNQEVTSKIHDLS